LIPLYSGIKVKLVEGN